MKKIILVILVFSVIFCFSLNSVSAFSSQNVFLYDNKEITVFGNIDYCDMEYIADYIAFGNSTEHGVSVCALNCILGHSIVTGITVTEVEHNVYENAFRCVESAYDVEYCSRPSCDYFIKTLLYRIRIGKCHG